MVKVIVASRQKITASASSTVSGTIITTPAVVYPQVTEGEGLPTEDGSRVGDIYHDTLTGNLYRWED